MAKLNVLFISSWYPSDMHPTLGNFVQKHAESVNPLVNLRVLYATSKSGMTKTYKIENSIINNIDTTIVYYKKVTNKIPILSQLIKSVRYRKAYSKGLKYLKLQTKFNRIDLTHCNITFQSSYFARYLKRKYKIPYLITEHSTIFSPYKNEYTKLNYLHKYLIKKGIKEANYIVPVSEQLKKSMQNLGLTQKYKVIGNVVNTTIFKPKSTYTSDKPLILHISHMDNNQKNSYGLLNAIKLVSKSTTNFVFKIIADDNINKTKELINSFNFPKGLVMLESTKSTENIAKAYQNSSFFILYSNFETFSVVLAEAWACGLPCIYSKCGGLTDIKNDILGIQVKVKNDIKLSESIIEMLNTYDKYDKTKIRNFASHKFDNVVIGKSYLELYQQIVKNDF